MGNLTEGIITHYDVVVGKVFTVIKEFYKDNDWKIAYTINTLLIIHGIMLIVPVVIIFEDLLHLNVDSYILFALGAILLIALAVLHHRRYKSIDIINKLIKERKNDQSIKLNLFYLIYILTSACLWSISILV